SFKEGDDQDAVSAKIAAAINDANLGIGINKNADDNYEAIIRADADGDAAVTSITFSAGTASGLTASAAFTITDANKVAADDSTVKKIDISNAAGAQSAVLVIDDAIKQIDSQRAELGAVQNRFENTIANLQSIGENVSAAKGRIQDTDYAAETAALSKNQILQQAGTAILAQANQLPQAVLSLLQ